MASGESTKVCYNRCADLVPVGTTLTNIPVSLVDYILFIQADVDLEPSPNEVRDTKYVSADELKAMFEQPGLTFTPWFKLICNSMLFEWWSHLGTSALDKYKNETQIRRM
jgi:isopentenyl-diphosphate delta-isomerase